MAKHENAMLDVTAGAFYTFVALIVLPLALYGAMTLADAWMRLYIRETVREIYREEFSLVNRDRE